uniref:sulfate transporter CysZ n=1 Tax=Thaumasiovibrio occultus TaxID=1891184 RepID=UPI000B361AC6|nr:sulfate transporter CysZ [Thaumasiovibrio occultus]
MQGINYFVRGVKIATQPGIRRYVILPLLANILIMGSAIIFLYNVLFDGITHWVASLSGNWQWLSFILFPLAFIVALVALASIFTTITHIIAAPFNGLLAERVEAMLTNETLPNSGLGGILRDIPRILSREWQKLVYYIPRALLLLLLLLVPVIGQTVGPALWFLFGAWMMAIQFLDYPFDNHKVPFKQMRSQLAATSLTSCSFGAVIMLSALIPFLNLVIMPIAVCGATALWVDQHRHNVTGYTR